MIIEPTSIISVVFNLSLQSSNKTTMTMMMMMMMIMMTASVSGTENMDIKFVVENALDLMIKQLNHIDALTLDLRPPFLNFELTEISLVFVLSIIFL